MRPFESLGVQVQALVHESAGEDHILQARHMVFLGTRLALGAVILALVPLYLAFSRHPSLTEALAFAWVLLPLAGAFHVSRTGRLLQGQMLSIAGLLGLAVTLALSGNPMAPAAVALLILAPAEALFTMDRLAVAATAGAAALAVLLLGAFHSAGYLPFAAIGFGGVAAFTLAGLFQATILAYCSLYLQNLRQRLALIGLGRHRILAETMSDLVMRHDRTGAVLHAVNDAASFQGLSGRDLTGRGFFERVHVADRPTFLRAISDAAAGSAAVSAQLRLRTGSMPSTHGDFDEPIFSWAEMRCRRFDPQASMDAGEDAALVSVVRDISAIKERELELETARAEAERANIWKDQFLANVSHELRTPLNAIIGFSEMLASPDYAPRDAAKQREYAGIIHSSGEHLLSVVNCLLDVSKIEAGSFLIEPEPFAIAPLVRSVCDMMQLRAEQGGVSLTASVSDSIDEIHADQRACRQVLINLVSNAVKFTPEGGSVRIDVRREGAMLVLNVADTGIGIHAPDLPRLGDPFFQARASYDRPYEGTGLGLSLVRGLVGLHSGTISVESAPGEGTIVCVRLPLDGPPAQRPNRQVRIKTIARRGTAAPTHSVSPSRMKKIA